MRSAGNHNLFADSVIPKKWQSSQTEGGLEKSFIKGCGTNPLAGKYRRLLNSNGRSVYPKPFSPPWDCRKRDAAPTLRIEGAKRDVATRGPQRGERFEHCRSFIGPTP